MSRRFIFAFGGAGLFTFLTAATGLAGVGWNSRWLLGTYSVLLVIMLLVQAAVAITLFADDSWRKYLPPDQTGEFHKVQHTSFTSFPAPDVALRTCPGALWHTRPSSRSDLLPNLSRLMIGQ